MSRIDFAEIGVILRFDASAEPRSSTIDNYPFDDNLKVSLLKV